VLWQGEDVCTHLHRWALAVVVALALTCTAGARAGDLQITHAWILPVDKVGVDVPLLLTVVNNGAEEDALMRVRCPVANFSEKYTVDRGEGAPSRRAVRSIPIAAGKTTELDTHNPHVMLLQMRETLAEGQRFTCTITFKAAGTLSTEIRVSSSR
jgi:hypothetical protein